MQVYLLRGNVSPEKCALEATLTSDDSRLVVSTPTNASLEEVLSTLRHGFLTLVLMRESIIVISAVLRTRRECDEFIEFAVNNGYSVTSLIVEGSSDGQPLIQTREASEQLRPSFGCSTPQTESPLPG